MPGDDTAVGAVTTSLVSNVNDVTAESSDSLTNTFPGAVVSNRICW